MKHLDRYLWLIIAIMFLLLFIFWSVGFFLNGLYSYKFDLGSCWQGVGALGGAGGITIIKYITDSCKNSKLGEMPDKEMDHERGIPVNFR